MMEKGKTKLYKKWWFWLIVLLIMCFIIIFAYVSIGKNNENSETIQANNKIEMTAEEITNKLKGKCSNIGEIVVYNEETDINELLGRPNSYTSKTVFAIITIEQPEKMTLDDLKNDTTSTEAEKKRFLASNNEPLGGTIEVFNNKEDMQKRKDYLASMMSSGNTFLSSSYAYMYSNGCALLRIHRSLTPAQAKEYEDAFNEIMNNN